MPDPPDTVPRWDPGEDRPSGWDPEARDVPRWDPSAAEPSSVPRWEPPREEGAPRPGRRPGAPGRRPAARPRSPFGAPFVWWRRHPWAVVWISIFLTPVAVLGLRVLDESDHHRIVAPLQWVLLACFVATLVFAVLRSAARSAGRVALGLVAALAGFGVLLWPMIYVTLGRAICPAHAGRELGVTTAASLLEGWKAGEADGRAWKAGEVDPTWVEKSKAIALLEYNLVDSGCWERIAPIAAGATWHEFRVSVKAGDSSPLLKDLVVHTASTVDGWKITSVEGPLP